MAITFDELIINLNLVANSDLTSLYNDLEEPMKIDNNGDITIEELFEDLNFIVDHLLVMSSSDSPRVFDGGIMIFLRTSFPILTEMLLRRKTNR